MQVKESVQAKYSVYIISLKIRFEIATFFLKVIDQLFADFRNKFFLAFLKSTNLDKNIFLEPKAE